MMKMTIGIPTYKDPQGVFQTIQPLIKEHRSDILHGRLEILLVDNAPGEPEAAYTRDYIEAVNSRYQIVRYIEKHSPRCAALAKDTAVRLASGDVVVIIDSHVFLADECLDAIWRFFRHADNHDVLLHGPLLHFDMRIAATHMEPGFRKIVWGHWAVKEGPSNPAYWSPFEIGYMGCGMFACRRDRWVGMNRRFRGVCAEEGYLQDKWRLRGGRVMCHPGARWIHRGPMPGGITYPVRAHESMRNFVIQRRELNQPVQPVVDHFLPLVGQEMVELVLRAAECDQEADETADPLGIGLPLSAGPSNGASRREKNAQANP